MKPTPTLRLPVLMFLWVLALNPVAYGATIKHPKITVHTDRYMIELLKIALSYSPTNYEFIEHSEKVSGARAMTLVSEGELSVMWTGASIDKDKILKPIHIPAYKGLMGHRIFIIRQGDQARFDNVATLDDLKRITMGQGRFWSDTKILKNAGFTVITATKPVGLLHMVDGARFDAFPRGVHEPWTDMEKAPELPLTVEKNLVLKYTMPYYFYVSKENLELASDILDGLENAIADGTFDKHFYADPKIREALERSKLSERTLFSIPNPNISDEVPIEREALWLDLDQLENLAE